MYDLGVRLGAGKTDASEEGAVSVVAALVAGCLESVFEAAEAAVRDGNVFLVATDRLI